MNAFSLEGRVALVTGAGRGIGLSIADRFARAGAAVVLANRTLEVAESAAARMRAAGLKAQSCGFSPDLEAARYCVGYTVAEFGALDIVVHNAGGCTWRSLESLEPEVFTATVDLNLGACFWLTQAALPHLRKRPGGRILVTSSVTGPRSAMLDSAHYAAAKAGVNGFIRSAALELAQYNITVNGVEPGMIRKDSGRLSEPSVRAQIESFIPLGALGEPDDIASAMLFLASREAGWVTGQTLVVDGGAGLPETGHVMAELHARRQGVGGAT